MDFFAKLESWDYLAGIIVIISLWLITFGINKLHAANPQLVDVAKELERIAKEKEKAENGLRITEKKLSNEKFVANAPEAVVNAEREKAAKYRELIAKLEESAKAMQA